jgi:hypothetical protein
MAKFARVASICTNNEPGRLRPNHDMLSEVRLAVSDVREAMIWLKSCSLEQQRAFPTMLFVRARSR